MDLQQHNLQQIERLNQRGGRTLSIVDLIAAGTIGVEMAACAMRAMAEGASILTGARPGGAGKTTLMAAILGFLPPEVPILTVDDPRVIHHAVEEPGQKPACYLVHEIGSGHWYGYLWGPDVAEYLRLAEPPRRIASCLHADTLEELTAILSARPLGVDREALGRVQLVLFMHVERGRGGYRRRVATFHQADGRGGHRLLYQWDAGSDAFRQVGDLPDPDGLAPYVDFVRGLVDDGEVEYAAVRRRVVGFYREEDHG